MKAFVVEPGDGLIGFIETGCEQQWVVGALLKPDFDVRIADGDSGGGVDEVAKEMSGTGALITISNTVGKDPVEAAGHQGQLEIAIDLHGDGGGERVHVEEVNAVGDAVFNEHALGVAADHTGRGPAQLVGQQEGGVLMTEIGDGELTDRTFIIIQGDPLIENPGRTVLSGDVFQCDAAPGR